MKTQERIDNLMPDSRETARSIHNQVVALQHEKKISYAAAKQTANAGQNREHSPLPWTSNGIEIRSGKTIIGLIQGEGIETPYVEEAWANGKLIVASVSGHEKLQRACNANAEAYQQKYDECERALQAMGEAMEERDQAKAHAAKLAEALRECITEQGAMSDRSHYNAKRRLAYITDTAKLALTEWEANKQ